MESRVEILANPIVVTKREVIKRVNQRIYKMMIAVVTTMILIFSFKTFTTVDKCYSNKFCLFRR